MLVVLLAAGCWPDGDFPATVDVQVVNDLTTPVTVSLCTSSCAREDLQERRTVAVGAETMVTVNGDPAFPSVYAVQSAGGDRCLVVSANESGAVGLVTAKPVASLEDCRPPSL